HAQGIADEAHRDGIAEPDLRWIDLDLDAARLAGLRVELDIGEAAADDEQGIAAFERVLRRPRAQKAHAAGAIRALIGHTSLPENGLGDGRAEDFRHLLEFLPRAQRAPAGENDRLLAGVEQRRRALQRL